MVKTAPKPPLGRRERKALAVRQALFDAGLTAFERQPVGLVSVLDITETADVAKGVFYLQFRSKDDYLLALWEEVQKRFLSTARPLVEKRRSPDARLEAMVDSLRAFVRSSPAAARFWLRMSGYFPDEIGEPGHVSNLRRNYIHCLAELMSGRPSDRPVPADIERAEVFDVLGWAAVGAELREGTPRIDAVALVKATQAALSTAGAGR